MLWKCYTCFLYHETVSSSRTLLVIAVAKPGLAVLFATKAKGTEVNVRLKSTCFKNFTATHPRIRICRMYDTTPVTFTHRSVFRTLLSSIYDGDVFTEIVHGLSSELKVKSKTKIAKLKPPKNIPPNIRLQKTSSRRLDQDEYIRLSHTSPRLLGQDQYICLPYVFKTSSRRLVKTSSRHLQNVFKTSCQDVFKTTSKRLQDVLQKRLQDLFKTSSRRLQDLL